MTQIRSNRPGNPGAVTSTPSHDTNDYSIRCQRCHRPLRASLSVLRCLGPVCARLDHLAVS